MDYNREYIDLLKRSLAGETETVRLYLACMAVAPPEHIPKLLEVQTDETDHQAIIADLLLEAVSGQSADQEELIPGVD
jgi:rubrerythrin